MQEEEKRPVTDESLDEGLTDLMQAHIDDVTGGLSARHNSWRQTV